MSGTDVFQQHGLAVTAVTGSPPMLELLNVSGWSKRWARGAQGAGQGTHPGGGPGDSDGRSRAAVL